MTPRYEPHEIETKWQRVWEDERAFNVPNPVPGQPTPENHWYQLEMLPYPSGPSLHMGHVLNYTMGDVQTHVRRRSGWHVVRPMGWDAFGLPAENAAIREGKHPRETIERNIETMRAQMKRLGWAIDWEREVAAHQPTFYRWTQWLFQQFVAHDLCYRKEGPVNWCPNDQTVIANEYVVDGRCERCGAEVELRNMTQWFMRTTAYADELLEYDLPEGGFWPERTKAIQRNWIGRSEGAEILFRVEETGEDVAVFTTRADTLYGATFFVVAPEHPFVAEHGSEEAKEYARHAGARPVEERAAATTKTGVFTGLHAINPINDELLPIWVADYVLMDYGTGAIMAVPAHDERDGEFAETFVLPTKIVIDEDGKLVNSGRFDGLPAEDGARAIVGALEADGRGKATVNYRLRDWSVSRQRYWGCPIPFIHCEKCGVVPVPEDQLPVILPDIEDYAPKGKPPLAAERGVHGGRMPAVRRPSAARPGHDGHVRRLVLVLPPLHRLAQRRGAVRPLRRRLLAAGLPVHRRHRPLDRAPALLALLRQGDERLGDGRLPRAVRAHVPPGLGDARRHEDVEDEGERRGAEPVRRRVRRRRRAALHPLHGPRRPGHGVDADRGSRASSASCAGSGVSCTRSRRRRRRRASGRERWRGRRTRRSLG